MSIRELIKINTHYTRSVNVERDGQSVAVSQSYIPTPLTVATVERIAQTMNDVDAPRAWALVGPYGSGKSAFAIFLSNLLGEPADSQTEIALQALGEKEAELAEAVRKSVGEKRGYLKVLLTGSPESMSHRLAAAIHQSCVSYWSRKKGAKPKLIANSKKLADSTSISPNELKELVSDVQQAVENAGGKGVLILVDELGKYLEYESRHHGANDIYLLQVLAEQAYASNGANLYIFALLHQSFDQYARHLNESLRNEWNKVQGRFESVPFIESSEQILQIVSAAIQHDLSSNKEVRGFAQHAVKCLVKASALPQGLEVDSAESLFSACYPLHPLAALMLPVLCQRVAQNERTLFSYLGSRESFGLAHSVESLMQVGEWTDVADIFDYFILNQPAAVSDQATHRRWTEVTTALERIGDAEEKEIQLLKVIGLLNIIGARGGLKASPEILKLAMGRRPQIDRTLQSLQEKSVINFRKYGNEYRVWQGSDFDLEHAIQDEMSVLGNFSLVKELNKRTSLQPVVARRYSITTGTLRSLQPHFVDREALQATIASKEPSVRIFYYLVQSESDSRFFNEYWEGDSSQNFSNDIWVMCPNGSTLRDLLCELIALERVQVRHQELHADPVATRELEDRFAAVELIFDAMLEEFTNQPERSLWFWQGKEIPIGCKRDFQFQISRVLEKCYDQAPIIKNELINRDLPSSQAIAARNKLLSLIFTSVDQENLGMEPERFPPEKGIYLSLLKASGIHRMGPNGRWSLLPPKEGDDPLNIRPAWGRIEQFFCESESAAKPFTDLDGVLTSPPFGLKKGVLPILYIVAYIVHHERLALYEDGAYCPYLGAEQLERFVKRPEIFRVQQFAESASISALLETYERTLFKNGEKGRNLVAVARALANFVSRLSAYTKQTKRLSQATLSVRDAVLIARSPHTMILETVPQAMGFGLSDIGSSLSTFESRLREALQELQDSDSQLYIQLEAELKTHLGFSTKLSLSEFRAQLQSKLTTNFAVKDRGKEFVSFAMHLQSDELENDAEWHLKVWEFLGQRMIDRWNESTRLHAEERLRNLAIEIEDEIYIRKQSKVRKGASREAGNLVFLKMVNSGGFETKKLINETSAEAEDAVCAAIEEIKNVIDTVSDKNLKLLVLARLFEELASKNSEVMLTSDVGDDNSESRSFVGEVQT